MPHKPGHKKRKKFKGTLSSNQRELADAPDIPKGTPDFIPAAQAPEQFKQLGGGARPGDFPGTLRGLNNLNPATLRQLAQKSKTPEDLANETRNQPEAQPQDNQLGRLQAELEAAQEADKEKRGTFKTFFTSSQRVKDAAKALNDFRVSDEGPGRFDPEQLPGAIGDAALLGPVGEGVGAAVGLGVKALRGGRALTQGGRVASEFSKLGAKRRDAVAQLIKGNTRKGLSPIDAAVSRDLAATKLSNILSRPGSKIKPDAAIRIINSVNKWDKPKTIKFLQKKPVKATLKAGGALIGADILTTWYALDNIMDGLRFMVPDIVEGVENGTLTREEAISKFAEADATMNLAYTKVRWSARLDPLLWPAAKLLLTSSDIKRDAYFLKRNNAFVDLGL